MNFSTILTIHLSSSQNFFHRYTLRNGKSLNLAGQNLSEIPDSLARDASEAEVTCIDFSKNQFQLYPDKLSVVSTVKELKLSNNRLLRLPEWIGEYKHLQFIDLSNNQLSTLPDGLNMLIYLREIILSFNR